MMADRIIPAETDLSFILLVFKYCKILKSNFVKFIQQTLAQASVTNRSLQRTQCIITPPPFVFLVTLDLLSKMSKL